MYNPLIPTVSYKPFIGVSFTFDMESLENLVKNSIIIVNRSINYFKRNRNKNKDTDIKILREKLVNEIGVSMEIIESVVWSYQISREITFNEEMKKDIKKNLFRVEELIKELGKYNKDFMKMSSTQRAMPSKDVMDHIKKNW